MLDFDKTWPKGRGLAGSIYPLVASVAAWTPHERYGKWKFANQPSQIAGYPVSYLRKGVRKVVHFTIT